MLLAVSGGLDSVVLAHMLATINQNFSLAHCNFQLRGVESDEDERFVASLAKSLGRVLHTEKFDTDSYKKEFGLSTQMAARELRYAWFSKLCTEFGYSYLATAHHLDDHLETITANFINGTGIAGLHGIRPIREQTIRPLLVFTRSELEGYANENGFSWRHDQSNDSDDYTRNYIRHHVIPNFKKVNPGILTTIQRNSEQWHQTELLMTEQVCAWKNDIWEETTDTITIDTSKIDSHPAAALLLYEMIKHLGFNFLTCQDIMRPREASSGKHFTGPQHTLALDRHKIIITPLAVKPTFQDVVVAAPSDQIPEIMGKKWRVEVFDYSNWAIQKSHWVFQADLERVKWPLTIRKWQEGDALVPLGMKGKKKVSDLMIDAKIPVNLKSTQLVVCDTEGLIWAVGLRISERVKVTTSTKRVLTIKVDYKDDQSI